MPSPTIFSVHQTKSKESIAQKTEAFLGLRDAPYSSDFSTGDGGSESQQKAKSHDSHFTV
jgi:hypothetical protein